jgi:adenylate kinase
MIILILGPLGSGKGTQAKRLARSFNLHFISMGDLLRQAAQKDDEIDKLINEKGKLVPAYTTYKILKGYLDDNKITDNIIFDGYPRMVQQYEFLREWLEESGKKIDLAIVLEVSEKESMRRLSGRREDPKTGRIYNINTSPKPGPKVDVKRLIRRDDDQPEAIKARLKWYQTDVVPLIKRLEEEGIKVKRIDGERPVEKIQADLFKLLERAAK